MGGGVGAVAHGGVAYCARGAIPRRAAAAPAARLRGAAGLAEKVRRVFASEGHRDPSDADAALYDGFINDADRRQFARIRSSAPAALRGIAANLRDPRCPELLLRYRARNWPESLDAGEREAWNEYRRRRLGRDSGLSEYDFESYRASIATLRAQHEAGPAQALLDALEDWGRQLEADIAV
jgi:exodeoxyribonuclease-1